MNTPLLIAILGTMAIYLIISAMLIIIIMAVVEIIYLKKVNKALHRKNEALLKENIALINKIFKENRVAEVAGNTYQNYIRIIK